MTDHPIIYSGFDTIELSYRVALPRYFLDALAKIQAAAKAENRASPYNCLGVELFIEPSGGQGGYAYRAHTGPLGLIWKFREATAKSPWSVHVKFRAHGLAVKGPLKMKAEADLLLQLLGCKFDSIDVRIARADFAVDIVLDGFVLNTNNFVSHARSTISEHIERTRTGDAYNYVRIGRMPGKQLCVYNKSDQVLRAKDTLWQHIYEQAVLERLGLIIDDFAAVEIWRFELRAGKKFLDTKFRLRTWDYFLSEAKPCFLALSQAFKLIVPCDDLNRTRWPLDPIWRSVITEIERFQPDQKPIEIPDFVWRQLRYEYQDILDKQLLGLLLSLAACEGIVPANFCDFTHTKVEMLTKEFSKSTTFSERYSKRRAEYTSQFKA